MNLAKDAKSANSSAHCTAPL